MLNKNLLVFPLLFLLGSCASLMSSVTAGLAEDLSLTIMNSEDVDTVREGIPAYLLMIDSFLRSSPDNSDLLLAASSLNGAFGAFTTGSRSVLLADKSLKYALRAACVESRRLCGFRQERYNRYTEIVDALGHREIEVAYAVGVAWTGWIQAHSDDFSAIGELGKVKYLLERVIQLNENYSDGGAHLYMGGLETILPAAMGGKPEKGKAHFEQAIRISNGNFLMAKVVYAQQYARLVFDKQLHDQLLNEVLAADPVVEGLTLANMVARRQAEVLLAESDDYF